MIIIDIFRQIITYTISIIIPVGGKFGDICYVDCNYISFYYLDMFKMC